MDTTADIDLIWLDRLPDIQDVMMKFLEGEIKLLERSNDSFNRFLSQYSAYWNIPFELYQQEWAKPGFLELIRGTLRVIKTQISSHSPLDSGLRSMLGQLDGYWHTYIREGKFRVK